MEKQYVAIDLHARRSLIVRENEAGEEVGIVRIDNDPIASAWPCPCTSTIDRDGVGTNRRVEGILVETIAR